MAQQVRKIELIPPGEGRLIEPREWKQQRWGWLEGVRRDAALNFAARTIAHVLALDYANHLTARCDPSVSEIATVLTTSHDTVKRAIKDLIAQGWVVRHTGRGRSIHTHYGFVTRAQVVVLHAKKGREKGANLHPKKGANTPPYSGPEKGANLHLKGGKSAPPYIEPYKNHNARPTGNGVPGWITSLANLINAGHHVNPVRVSKNAAEIMLRNQLVTEDQLHAAGIEFRQTG